METGFDLPAPGVAAAEHSARVCAALRDRINNAGGWLSFADYMDLVLYAPGLGYYAAGARKFGADGDFTTAPELGGLFARCLSRVVRGALRRLPGGVIVEVGGGSGVLAADLLAALRDDPPARYLLLEVSGELRERQAATLAARVPELLDRVTWLDRLPEKPVRGVLIANEVLDALPVERFCVRDGHILQWGVRSDGLELRWSARPAMPPLRDAVRRIESALGTPLPEGYTSEICLRQQPWVATLAGSLQQGLALFIDYGCSRREYYHPDRRDGTLACHYRHRRHGDPFFLPGLQDLTAWVDFSAVVEAAEAAGLTLEAYSTQAHFLLAAGILEELAASEGGADGDLARSQQAGQLLVPGQMGEHFKVLALTRDFQPDLPLSLRDLRGRLQARGAPPAP
jgi:SAM-dependent MidA family methyltransferase